MTRALQKYQEMTTKPKTEPADRRHFVDPAGLPDLYIMILSGECLEPVFKNGAKLLFSKSDPYALGDFVVIYRRPNIVPPGEFPAIVKRLIMAPPHWVTFPWVPNPMDECDALFIVEMLNPPKNLFLRCINVLAIHKCLGPAPEGDDDLLAIGAAPKASASKQAEGS